MQHLVECGCGYHQVGIERCDDRTDGIDEMRRIRPGPDEDRVVLKAAFGKWYVDLLGVAAVQLDAACIARDADDLVGGSIGKKFLLAVELIVRSQTETAADGVLVGPELICDGLAEDNGGLRLAGLRRKAAAGEQRNAERCEVVGLDECVVEDGLRVVRRGLCSIERYGGHANAPAVGRPRAGDCSDFWQTSEAVAQLTDEGVPAVGAVFRAFGKLQIEIDDVLRVVSGVHLERMDGAANQHASSDQEHEGDGNLGGDEDVAQPAAAHGRRCGAGIDGRGKRGAGAFERRGEPEENARNQRYGEDVGKDPEVGRDMQHQRAIFGGNGLRRSLSPTL